MSKASAAAAPLLSITAAGASNEPVPGVVRVGWRIENRASGPAEILEGWLPHSRFFGERQAYEPVLYLGVGEGATVHRMVHLVAEPGEVVGNAFLNLLVRSGEESWRVLTRMRVEYHADGSVGVAVEAVTAHRVGFAKPVTEEGRR